MALPPWLVETKGEGTLFVGQDIIEKLEDIVKPLYIREVDKDWKHKDLDEAYAGRLGHANQAALHFFYELLPRLQLERAFGYGTTEGVVFCLIGGSSKHMFARLQERLSRFPAPCVIYGLHLIAGGTARVHRWSIDWDQKITRATWRRCVYLPSKQLGPALRGMVRAVSSPVVEIEFIPDSDSEV